MEEVDEQLQKQPKSSKGKTASHLQPWQFKPGQSGNPAGRKPGPSLKEYAKNMLAAMTYDEKQEFMKGLSKDIIWKMAEGNPKQDTEISGEVVNRIVSIDE